MSSATSPHFSPKSDFGGDDYVVSFDNFTVNLVRQTVIRAGK
jgi:hypothetical protein